MTKSNDLNVKFETSDTQCVQPVRLRRIAATHDIDGPSVTTDDFDLIHGKDNPVRFMRYLAQRFGPHWQGPPPQFHPEQWQMNLM